MGRRKLNMLQISNEKSRNVTFVKRKAGLKKKLHEFTTLCDVDACMIVYGPNHRDHLVEPETWPENKDEVYRVLNRYLQHDKGNCTTKRSENLTKFFEDRKKKLEYDLEKMRKKNDEFESSMWEDQVNQLSKDHLEQYYNSLDTKIDFITRKVEFIKGNQSMLQIVEPRIVQQNHARLDQTQSSAQPIAYYPNPHEPTGFPDPSTGFPMGPNMMNLVYGYDGRSCTCSTTCNQQHFHDQGLMSFGWTNQPAGPSSFPFPSNMPSSSDYVPLAMIAPSQQMQSLGGQTIDFEALQNSRF
ncbi:hypothetical protein IFM89_017817 [Coptis chinensis]|uniref:MADS-box domain-containing protein n=1 Tax=Coptis chinensis TaxID=261450 RepID=A0A835LHN5_9MAGN|nr:hypothetical protein IFM89_017817 [Coptis chinensis]